MEAVSFGKKLKTELTERIAKKMPLKKAELLGMLCFCNECSQKRIIFSTECAEAVTVFSELMQEVFGILPELSVSTNRAGGMFTAQLNESSDVLDVFAEFFLNDAVFPKLSDFSQEELSFFLCGAYLACGTVLDPTREYRMEFAVRDENQAYRLCEQISRISEPAAITMRKKQFLVYTKSSECIEDLMIFMGAKLCAMELMNIKIYKDIRNQTNRRSNCETANIGKTVVASLAQAEDIRLVKERAGWEAFPENLLEIAQLRLENPEMSLSELGKLLKNPLSRSGVNHRFEKIRELAEHYRK